MQIEPEDQARSPVSIRQAGERSHRPARVGAADAAGWYELRRLSCKQRRLLAQQRGYLRPQRRPLRIRQLGRHLCREGQQRRTRVQRGTIHYELRD
jgi:hypothetical protein